MRDRLTAKDPGKPQLDKIPIGSWIMANALGLGLAFGLFGLVGGVIEAMGADHDSAARNVPAILAMAAGGVVFATLRRRALHSQDDGSAWRLVLVGLSVPAGFLAGLGVAPFDWMGALLVGGTVGAALQLGSYRRVDARGVLASAACWLAAGLIFTASAVLVIDVFLVGVLGLSGDSALGFAIVVTTLGMVGGAAGAGIEANTVGRRND